MKNNAIKIDSGIEVYETEIHRYADEYINSLSDDASEITSLMRKPPIFKGLLKYININLFRITDKDKKYNNKNSRIDYSDINLLNSLWDIYTGLCYKYLQNPTILNFSLFTGISMDAFNDWKTGKCRSNNDEISSKHSQSYKKWLSECEASLYDGAASGNPGSMFLLKANYGYTEQPQRIELIGNNQPAISKEELIAEYGTELLNDRKRPDF